MAQCVSNRCKDLFKRKKGFGVLGTLICSRNNARSDWLIVGHDSAVMPTLGGPKKAKQLVIKKKPQTF